MRAAPSTNLSYPRDDNKAIGALLQLDSLPKRLGGPPYPHPIIRHLLSKINQES